RQRSSNGASARSGASDGLMRNLMCWIPACADTLEGRSPGLSAASFAVPARRAEDQDRPLDLVENIARKRHEAIVVDDFQWPLFLPNTGRRLPGDQHRGHWDAISGRG